MTLASVWTWLCFQRHRQGLAAVLGLLLLAAALAARWLLVDPAQARGMQVLAENQALRQTLARRSAAPPDAAARSLAALEGLPAADQALQAVARMHRSAAAHGVVLAQGEYRIQRDAGARWWRYQIHLPAHAPYPPLRSWIAEVMNTVPGAALDEVSLRREDAGQADLDARVRFTLYLKAD